MIKNNSNGITLVALIVTIIVLLIILSITIISADDLIGEVQNNRLKSVMYLVKARAESVWEDYLFDETDNLGDKVVTPEQREQIENVGWSEINNDDVEYRIWSIEKLNEEGIETKNLSENQIFIIKYDKNSNEVDVAINKGILDENGEKQYSLSDLEK